MKTRYRRGMDYDELEKSLGYTSSPSTLDQVHDTLIAIQLQTIQTVKAVDNCQRAIALLAVFLGLILWRVW